MVMTSLRVAFVSVFGFVVGCTGGASSTGFGDGGAVDDAGGAGNLEGGAEPDAGSNEAGTEDAGTTNPTGYPTTNIGWAPRAGSKPGQTIANIKLPGYPANSATLGTVSMADLFDPNGATHDVIVVVGATLWDASSPTAMTNALAAKSRRVRVLSVLGEGTKPGGAATTSDLGTWRGKYPAATHMLDAGWKAFGPAFDAAAVPLVMVISARTMEICSSAVGAPQLSGLESDVTDCAR